MYTIFIYHKLLCHIKMFIELTESIRVSGAYSVRGFGEAFPRSGTPPPSPRGPESGWVLGVGSPLKMAQLSRETIFRNHLSKMAQLSKPSFGDGTTFETNSPNRGVPPSKKGIRGVGVETSMEDGD
ncbi:hypothetical protein Hdeb2414_s0012g00378541 [Helianthus debilis subsp. tardiflorus]